MLQVRTFLERYKHYLILLLVTLVVFWPLTLSIFSLKNDALVYFLPYRYHVSESIQHGNFPWWNPYLYTGLPLHSDIQSGVWNPVVMLISVFTTYNMTVLQWEVLLYLFVAAVGMYKLIRSFTSNPATALVTAIAYTCCGFMTDCVSMIPWITSAAYLPFVLLFFYRLLGNPELKTALKFSVALALLFTAGYPSFFMYSLYAMLAGTIVWAVFSREKKERLAPRLLYLFAAGFISLFICGPAILSWMDFFSYYERGDGASLSRSLSNPFPVFSSISYLVPSAVSREHPWQLSDISARNASTGVFMFLFFIVALLRKLSVAQKSILAGTLFSFLFSLGDATPIREWCYRFLPLMDSFRHPSSIRLFTTIGILLIAAPMLDQLLANPPAIKKRLMPVCIATAVIIVLLILFYSGSLRLFHAGAGLNKSLLDRLGFADLLFITGVIQLIFLSAFLFCLHTSRKKMIVRLIVINSIVCCWIAMPFTFISQVRTATVNNYIASFPKGTPIPGIQTPVKAADSTSLGPYGIDNFYSKQITIQDYVITPTINNAYYNFIDDKGLRRIVAEYPFIYFSDTSFPAAVLPDSIIDNNRIIIFDSFGRQQPIFDHGRGNIEPVYFSNNRIELGTTTENAGLLNLFQQYHHNWQAKVDSNETGIYHTNKAFMSIRVPAGKHKIVFQYVPAAPIPLSMYISGTIILLLLIYFIFQVIKHTRGV
jgi:hypothetical protein